MATRRDGGQVSLRTELLFQPGADELSPLGRLIVYATPLRSFGSDEQGLRLEQLQQRFYDLISLYQFGDRLGHFRRYVGDNCQSVDQALRRSAWLLPRVDRQLSAAQCDPDAGKCRACPWLTGRFDAGECRGRSCPDA